MDSHSFKEKTFGRLTYCDRCDGLLWGLAKQGVKCEDCDYVCHVGCKESASKCSKQATINPGRTLSSKIHHKLQQTNRTDPTLANTTSVPSTPIQPPLDTIKQVVTPESIEQSVISAAIQSMDNSLPVNDYLATLPPLHPQSTAKNFSRFVSRCGPIFGFRDQVILLLSWDQPIDTFVALVAYCIICFYPKLLLFIPQLAILNILISGYYKRFGDKRHQYSTLTENDKHRGPSGMTSTNHATSKTIPPSSAIVDNDDAMDASTPPANANTGASASAAAAAAAATAGGGPTRRSAFAFSFATAMFPMFDDSSPEYGRNLQNMQNMMGETSDLYDLVQAHGHYFDWSDEETSLKLLQGVLLSMVGLSVAVYYIPFHLICLAGGVGMFTINTRFCKYLVKELLPMFSQLGDQLMPWVLQQNRKMETLIQDQEQLREISLYENQRWSSEHSDFTSHVREWKKKSTNICWGRGN
ncbi:integral peroxisomal membrane peroxin-domain-containing protein [Absidia repens]|uniref:Integral peroxisomal membrane peroxin-domain-containing protein n=1 Tax=Absidia repens TaxID=90262 RepID=A0A1X2ICD0_9FUNG|nr:integral peroxisomal membrane peroxin-domain-containing protein [Absidia repens]